MATRKLLVTGHHGLVGGRLVQRAGTDWEVVGLSRHSGIDITDPQQVERGVAEHDDAAALVHLAAFTDVSAAYSQEGDRDGACYRLNVLGTRHVAAACRGSGVHLVHASTDFVFAGDRDEPYTEDDTPRPIEWYGATKLAAEEEARKAGSWCIARFAFPYLRRPAARPDLVEKIRTRLAGGEEAHLFTDQMITPTFGDDIADGLLLLAELRLAGELVHLTGSSWVSPHQLGLAIATAFGLDSARVRPSSLSEHLQRDPRPRQRSLKISNARWCELARRHGRDTPLTLEAGLAAIAHPEP